MQNSEYQKEAMRTASGNPNVDAIPLDLLHSVIGLSTEVGEINDAVKRAIWYGKEHDPVNVAEEFGDILWYCAVGMTSLGLDFSGCMQQNIDKLRARFPEKFTEENALKRDLDVERTTLEKSHRQKRESGSRKK